VQEVGGDRLAIAGEADDHPAEPLSHVLQRRRQGEHGHHLGRRGDVESGLARDAVLGRAGLTNYEISNWARSGHECRHNLLCWRQGDYRGIGCAAHSHEQGRRWWNVRTPERYIAALESGRSPVAAAEELDEAGRRLEGLQLALRTADGVPASAVPNDPALEPLVERDGDLVRLTVDGRLLANEVAVRLVPRG